MICRFYKLCDFFDEENCKDLEDIINCEIYEAFELLERKNIEDYRKVFKYEEEYRYYED